MLMRSVFKLASSAEHATPRGDNMASKHGGKRKGAGRRPLGPAKLQRADVRLSTDDIAYLRALGAGNLSAGVRRLVAEWRAGEDERANMD
jgi:hypothetical protein